MSAGKPPMTAYLRQMPARPNPPIPPDATSEAVRAATALVAEAVTALRTARDYLDEGAQVPGLPDSLGGSLAAYESVIEALRRTLEASVQWLDDKAELLHSQHSPLNKQEQKPTAP
jgi:hypothetical protein